MSGTSLDGLDISLIKSDGEKKIFPIYNITYSYSQEFKNEINFFIKYINSIDPKKIKVLKEFKLLERKVNHFLLEKTVYFQLIYYKNYCKNQLLPRKILEK